MNSCDKNYNNRGGLTMANDHTIYILLTHSGSLLSKCINIYTKEPYTHVSIALAGSQELYSFVNKTFNPYSVLSKKI